MASAISIMRFMWITTLILRNEQLLACNYPDQSKLITLTGPCMSPRIMASVIGVEGTSNDHHYRDYGPKPLGLVPRYVQ